MRDGLDHLARLRANLMPEKALQLSSQLRSVEARFEPIEDVIQRDGIWAQHAAGWLPRIRFLPTESDELYRHVDGFYRALVRLLYCDMAIRLFKNDRGRLPQELDELVPDFLRSVPRDPFSPRPLRYHPSQREFVLYSVGPDGHDDGGRASSTNDLPMNGEDLVLPAIYDATPAADGEGK